MLTNGAGGPSSLLPPAGNRHCWLVPLAGDTRDSALVLYATHSLGQDAIEVRTGQWKAAAGGH